MAVTVEEFQRIKKKVESLQQEVSEAKGVLQTHLAKLKEEFECDSVEEAEALLEELKGKAESSEQQYTELMDEFREKYGDLLDD